MKVRIILSFIAVFVIALWYYIFASPNRFFVLPDGSQTEEISMENSGKTGDQAPQVTTLDGDSNFRGDSPFSVSGQSERETSGFTPDPSQEKVVRDAEISERKVAHVTVDEDQIAFNPKHEFAGYTLKISGPRGFQSEETFASYDTPAFSVPKGHNGLYKYELVAIPYLNEQQVGAAGERLNNGRQVSESRGAASGQTGSGQSSSVEPVQSGTFSQTEQGTLSLNHGDHGLSDQDEDNL